MGAVICVRMWASRPDKRASSWRTSSSSRLLEAEPTEVETEERRSADVYLETPEEIADIGGLSLP